MSDVQTKGLFGTALPPFLATIQAHNEAYNAALVATAGQAVCVEDLRTVDGPRLCHLAWQLGLAQPHVRWNMPVGCYQTYWEYEPGGCRVACHWEPHINVSQAHAVLRLLGAQGWSTTLSTVPPLGGVVGCVEATKAGQAVRVYWGGGAFVDHEEAPAVVRLCVLALATAPAA